MPGYDPPCRSRTRPACVKTAVGFTPLLVANTASPPALTVTWHWTLATAVAAGDRRTCCLPRAIQLPGINANRMPLASSSSPGIKSVLLFGHKESPYPWSLSAIVGANLELRNIYRKNKCLQAPAWVSTLIITRLQHSTQLNPPNSLYVCKQAHRLYQATSPHDTQSARVTQASAGRPHAR